MSLPLTPAFSGGSRAVVLPAALAAFMAALVWIAWLAGSRAARQGPVGQDTGGLGAGELVAGRCFGQTFVAHTSGLYRVDLWLATYARANRGRLVLHIRPAPFAADWAAVEIDMADVSDNAYHAFEFEPLPLPAAVPAYFCLEAPDASPGNAVTVGGSPADTYASGRALLSSTEQVPNLQDLKFQLYYRPGLRLAAGEVLHRLAAGKPGVFGQPALYAGFIVAVSLMFGVLGWQVGWMIVTQFAQVLPAAKPRGSSTTATR